MDRDYLPILPLVIHPAPILQSLTDILLWHPVKKYAFLTLIILKHKSC